MTRKALTAEQKNVAKRVTTLVRQHGPKHGIHDNADLAKRLGITGGAVSHLLNGQRAFSPETFFKLCEIFKRQPGSLDPVWSKINLKFDTVTKVISVIFSSNGTPLRGTQAMTIPVEQASGPDCFGILVESDLGRAKPGDTLMCSVSDEPTGLLAVLGRDGFELVDTSETKFIDSPGKVYYKVHSIQVADIN